MVTSLKSWIGRTSASATYKVTQNVFVHSIIITNRSFENMIFNLSVLRGSSEVLLCKPNAQLASGESQQIVGTVFMLGDTVKLTTNVDCDYHFSMECR